MGNKSKALEMAEYAYQTVPVYYRIAEERGIDIDQISYEDLPVIDKSYFVESGMSCLSSKYIGSYIKGALQKGRTSGSTGKYTEVYWDYKEYRKSMSFLWGLRKKYYGINPWDRLCYFYPAFPNGNDKIEREHCLAFSRKCIFDGRLEAVYKEIVKYNPVWMILQPSNALLLCELAEQTTVPSSLRYIEMTGEVLTEPVRNKIQSVFQCHLANQYGTKEVNSIAYECPEGKLHCLTDNIYLETVGEKEELCVTTLQNRAMPLVRFNLEDRGKIVSGQSCPCGCSGDILELSAGRANDWIIRSDGSRRHPYLLMQLIDNLNEEMDGMILQYQIIQKDFDRFLINIITEEEVFKEIEGEIDRGIKKRLEDNVTVEVEWSEHLLPAEETGKLAVFRSEIMGEGD